METSIRIIKNYRLPFERAYRRARLKNHAFRKYSSETKKAEPNDPALFLL